MRVPAKGAPLRVTFKAYDRRHRLRLVRRAVVSLEKVQPNGPECKPTCYIARARLTRRGRLHDDDNS